MFKLNKTAYIYIFLVFLFCSNAYAKSDETYDTLRMMIDIMEIINNDYVETTEPKKLVIGAINGIVRTLDPYSQFMDEKAYKEMKTETQGSYGGVGLRIMIQDETLTVVTPLPDTPAYFAGILPEDKIIKIDDKSTENMSSDEAVRLMRGNSGTKVTLTIFRPSSKEEKIFTIKRQNIKIETVKKKMLENNIGYIRLSEFNAQSAGDLLKMMNELAKEKMQSLILDLRNNPGGLLDSSVNVCEFFIKEDSLVVSTKGRDKALERNYYTAKKPVFSDIDLVVLINRGSASASEIVAGTMQDYKRALIIGGNSFGKGSVQTVIPLSDGNALRMTIAKYYLPSGRTIVHKDEKKGSKKGITPDILIEVSPETEGKLYMQSESFKLPGNKDKKEEKTEDEVLNTAVKIIKEKKVNEYINNPEKYLQDYPKENDKTKAEVEKQKTDLDAENNKTKDVKSEKEPVNDERK